MVKMGQAFDLFGKTGKYDMKCLKKLFIFVIMPIHLYAAEPSIEIKELTRNVNSISNNIKLDKPLHLEFFLEGGYSGWFRVGWNDKDTGQWVKYTSGDITIGFYHKQTVPKGTDKSTIRVEGYTNTGILWDKYRTIFNHTLGQRTIYRFEGSDYYGIKTWGTTFAPKNAEYNPNAGSDVTNPANCLKLVLPDIPSSGRPE